MITVPSVGVMLTVIGVALFVTAALSALVGALFAHVDARPTAGRPTGGTRVPDAPAPTPAPAVPGQRTRQPAGV
jgi:hypothetical protein